MDAKMFAVGEEPAPIRNTAQESELHGVGKNVVFVTQLFVEGDQLLSEVFRHTLHKICSENPLVLLGPSGTKHRWKGWGIQD